MFTRLRNRTEIDRLCQLHDKMREWIDNGVRLSWLIDAESKTVWIYRPNSVEEMIDAAIVEGVEPVPGFRLDLTEI